MSNTNDCTDRHETIAALVLGELEAPAADEIKKHIDGCESCRLLYQALTAEEGEIQSAFEVIDERGKEVTHSLIAKAEDGSRKSSSGGSTLRRLWYDSSIPKRVAELAAAASIIIGVFVGIYHWTGSNVAWADVVDKFRSIPFFSASIYIKMDGAIAEPKQMELWMSRDGRSRIRVGKQVIFGDNGKVSKAFDITTRSQTEPDEMATVFLERIGEADEFSLDSIIKVMFRGEMKDVTPLVNPDAVISRDVVVFDVDIPQTPDWVRIWALRESRLPVRVKIWDPRNGRSTDAIFEYSREQADEFFDPNAFEKLIHSRQASSRVNFAYAYLTDPGGRQITPEDMFEQAGYHMPVIKHVGITPDGAVWVIADKGYNRTPSGYPIYGFSKIEDDLGREYRRVYASHRTATDQSMDVFVPLDYPFDKRRPKKIALTCQAERPMPLVIIGTVDVTEWKQDQLWPEGTITSSETQLAAILAWRHCRAKRYEKTERILATIEGRPEDNSAALERERIRLLMLLNQDKTDEACALAERLIPPLEKRYKAWKGTAPNAEIFSDALLALAYAGKFDKVKDTWQRMKGIDPELKSSLNNAARKHIRESMERSFETCLRLIVPSMSSKARLTIEQINNIFDINIKKNNIFEHYLFWDWNPEFEKPEYKNWERHLEELAEHYKTNPLPESMELLKHKKKEEYRKHIVKMPGIEGYLVDLHNRPLKEYASFYNFPESAGRLRMEDDIPDIELAHDLIYKEGIDRQQQILFLLDQLGLEIVEVNEPRTVWVARHDGSQIKDYMEVRAPVPFDAGAKTKTGMMWGASNAGNDFDGLFTNYMWWQNKTWKADCIIIINETGITGPVSRERPNWEGPEAPEIARKWFKDELGVDFTEETRTMKTWVVRKK